MKPFNLVLFAPEIPQNTGTIGRLCVSTDTKLHLVRPLGFSLDEKHLKRAGMDYWPHLDLAVYENWEEFLAANPGRSCTSSRRRAKQAIGMSRTRKDAIWCSAGSRADCRRNFTNATANGWC